MNDHLRSTRVSMAMAYLKRIFKRPCQSHLQGLPDRNAHRARRTLGTHRYYGHTTYVKAKEDITSCSLHGKTERSCYHEQPTGTPLTLTTSSAAIEGTGRSLSVPRVNSNLESSTKSSQVRKPALHHEDEMRECAIGPGDPRQGRAEQRTDWNTTTDVRCIVIPSSVAKRQKTKTRFLVVP